MKLVNREWAAEYRVLCAALAISSVAMLAGRLPTVLRGDADWVDWSAVVFLPVGSILWGYMWWIGRQGTNR